MKDTGTKRAPIVTRREIDEALPRVERGLRKYCEIQRLLRSAEVSSDREFQRQFNGFYRVRRSAAWQRRFFGLLERGKSGRTSYEAVLTNLHGATKRIEASFASKLLATIDPKQPVIDSIVLRHMGRKLRYYGATERRIQDAVEIHRHLAQELNAFLRTAEGKYLVRRFKARYPRSGLTPLKMLDLVLWQTRGKRPSSTRAVVR